MFIRQHDQTFRETDAINRFCLPLGIDWGGWPVDQLDEDLCRRAVTDPEAQQAILEAIQPDLTAVKTKKNYLTEDVVCLSTDMPNLDTVLAMFDKEHHHTDDEVRLVLAGRGIFGVQPPQGENFEIHVEKGDFIVIPAYTRHWFLLYPDRFIVALRIFKTPAGWTAIYDPPAKALLDPA